MEIIFIIICKTNSDKQNYEMNRKMLPMDLEEGMLEAISIQALGQVKP